MIKRGCYRGAVQGSGREEENKMYEEKKCVARIMGGIFLVEHLCDTEWRPERATKMYK